MQLAVDLIRSVELGDQLQQQAREQGYDLFELLVSTIAIQELLLQELKVDRYDYLRIKDQMKKIAKEASSSV